MTTTFVTVVRPPKADFEVLASAVAVLARAARATFRRLFQLGKPPAEVKREVCSEFGLLVRHWSGSRATAIQSVKSWREGSRERLRTLAHRLGDLRRRWPEEKLHPVRRRRNAVARRKAEAAIARLAKELAGLPRWCFGGRRLLRRGRLREWRRRRDGEALFCGGDRQLRWQPSCAMALRQPASPASAQLGGTQRRARRCTVQSTRRGGSRACDGPAGAGDMEGKAAAARQGAAVRDAGAAGASSRCRRRQRRSWC